jgi:hypothetical protein
MREGRVAFTTVRRSLTAATSGTTSPTTASRTTCDRSAQRLADERPAVSWRQPEALVRANNVH